MTIGVSELQKNISIFRNLTETLYIVDKKTNETLATVLPNKKRKKTTLTESLAGSLSGKTLPKKYNGNLEEAIKDAYHQEMMEKYGNLNEK